MERPAPLDRPGELDGAKGICPRWSFRSRVPADLGIAHRFPMLKRAIEHQVKGGRFDESLGLLEELLSLAPEDAGLSKLKARFTADLMTRAVQAQKIEAGTKMAAMLDARVPAAHLGDAERTAIAKAKEALYSL